MKVDFIYEKSTRPVNEDQILMADNVFAVFDGATSISGYVDNKGRTGGLIAAEIAKKFFNDNKTPLIELAQKANSNILEDMRLAKIDVSKKVNLWSTGAAGVRIFNDYLEWFQISDCLVLLLYVDGTYELPGGYYNHDINNLLKWKKQAIKGVKDIRGEIAEDLTRTRNEANVSYGFLNGEEAALKFFLNGRKPLNNISDILIFTDGFMPLQENPLDKYDFGLMVKLYKGGGLKEIEQYIIDQQNNDKDCLKYPRFKFKRRYVGYFFIFLI